VGLSALGARAYAPRACEKRCLCASSATKSSCAIRYVPSLAVACRLALAPEAPFVPVVYPRSPDRTERCPQSSDASSGARLGRAKSEGAAHDLEEAWRRTCSRSRELRGADPAPKAVSGPGRGRRLGTNVDLLPIRGRGERLRQ